MEPGPPALGAWSLSHCTTREALLDFRYIENGLFPTSKQYFPAFSIHFFTGFRLETASHPADHLWPSDPLAHKHQTCLKVKVGSEPAIRGASNREGPPPDGSRRDLGLKVIKKQTFCSVWRFLKKLEIELPYNPAIPLLGIHTKETRSERDTCTPMFITTLFIIARTWKQPGCPAADEWIRKLWYICTVEYYSAIKKNSFESVLMRWMKLEPIIQSEVSRKEKHQYSILMHIYGI